MLLVSTPAGREHERGVFFISFELPLFNFPGAGGGGKGFHRSGYAHQRVGRASALSVFSCFFAVQLSGEGSGGWGFGPTIDCGAFSTHANRLGGQAHRTICFLASAV